MDTSGSDSSNLPPLSSDPVPPSSAPLPAGPGGEQKSLSLMPDQLASLGLDEILPGKTYTIQLKSTGGGDDGIPDAGQSFEVLSADCDSDDDGAPTPSGGAMNAPDEGPEIVPPPMDDTNDSYNEADGDKKVLGFSRLKKPKREGLPDTKKMRDM